MKLAIMQPYFLPYIGYWQLLSAVDLFVVYDNIEYTKKGWINRNRMLLNGQGSTFSVPIKKDSDSLNINERYVSQDFNRSKLLAKIDSAYRKAPFFADVMPLIEDVVNFKNDNNLFEYIYHSINKIRKYLEIKTPVIVSSSINIDHSLRAEHKVLAICKDLKADTYINPIGGKELYLRDTFLLEGLELKFLKNKDCQYRQFDHGFVSSLSIMDILMFNNKPETISLLKSFILE